MHWFVRVTDVFCFCVTCLLKDQARQVSRFCDIQTFMFFRRRTRSHTLTVTLLHGVGSSVILSIALVSPNRGASQTGFPSRLVVGIHNDDSTDEEADSETQRKKETPRNAASREVEKQGPAPAQILVQNGPDELQGNPRYIYIYIVR